MKSRAGRDQRHHVSHHFTWSPFKGWLPDSHYQIHGYRYLPKGKWAHACNNVSSNVVWSSSFNVGSHGSQPWWVLDTILSGTAILLYLQGNRPGTSKNNGLASSSSSLSHFSLLKWNAQFLLAKGCWFRHPSASRHLEDNLESALYWVHTRL